MKAPILVEDGFGEDFGGGISQLTTTLYNAVFFGGYEDVEHVAAPVLHPRYPMGREATINFPSIDSEVPQRHVTRRVDPHQLLDTSITVSLYGDNDGRTVHEENRKILHTDPITEQLMTCPVKKPEEDPDEQVPRTSAPATGTAEPGETGYDVAFDRVIDQPGKPEYRRHYRSTTRCCRTGSCRDTCRPPPGAVDGAPAAHHSFDSRRPAATTTTTLRHR